MSVLNTDSKANPNRTDAESSDLAETFQSVRQFSRRIADPLSPEDCAIQSMDDVSPTRWHLAHTSWFFETFLLKPTGTHSPFDPSFEYLFNSYYNTVGKQFPRSKRGLISRPGLDQTLAYREAIDQAVLRLIEVNGLNEQQRKVLTIGLHHEQQHQELMLTDIKHVLSCNPLFPVFQTHEGNADSSADKSIRQSQDWLGFDGGVVEIGHQGDDFCFDNELPRHRVFLEPYQLRSQLVTNAEYIDFIRDGGYQRPEFWLSAGWQTVQENGWTGPLYWQHADNEWQSFTLSGKQPLVMRDPVCHVSYFEADAFARWAGHRLATEAEWEHAISVSGIARGESEECCVWSDQLIGKGLAVHPRSTALTSGFPLGDAMGTVWQWTASHYSAFPGYRSPQGALGEYNGKFMCNCFVLRGGSCATPSGHARTTYRNFFAPQTRWQFSGIRLAGQPEG